jgi:hypothetical protein
MVCGATPATQVTLRSVVAMAVFGVTSTFRGVYCRDCGLAMFRKRMSATLLTGWWGILHFFINLGVVFGNLGERARLMRLGPPVRNPGAGFLNPGRPVFLRAGFIASAAVLLIGGGFLLISATTPPVPFPADDQAYIGECAQHSGTEWTTVDCVGPHDGKVVSLSHDRGGCPSQDRAAKLPDGNYTCIDTSQ